MIVIIPVVYIMYEKACKKVSNNIMGLLQE